MDSLIYETIPELISEYIEFLMEKKAEGKKIIGFSAHEFIPHPILTAANVIPAPLIFAGTEQLTTAGSEYLTTSMCPYALSLLGAAENLDENRTFRFLSKLDGILSTNNCAADNITNEWISEILNIKRFYLHIPFIQDKAHRDYFESQIRKLTKELANFTGHFPTDEEIKNELIKYHHFYAFIEKIQNTACLGSVKLKIIQKLLLFGPNELDYNKMEKELEELKKEYPIQDEMTRILLIGGPIFIGDNLDMLLEEGGGTIIRDSTWLGNPAFYIKKDADFKMMALNSWLTDYKEKNTEHKELKNIIKQFSNPINYIADQFKVSTNSLHSSDSKRPLEDYLYSVKKEARACQAQGILNHIIKFCDLTGHHRHFVKETLNHHGWPMINLEKDYSRGVLGQLRTRVEAFIEMLRD